MYGLRPWGRASSIFTPEYVPPRGHSLGLLSAVTEGSPLCAWLLWTLATLTQLCHPVSEVDLGRADEIPSTHRLFRQDSVYRGGAAIGFGVQPGSCV